MTKKALSLIRACDRLMDMWLIGYFKQGGAMMWPLLLLGVFALIFFVERFLFLHKGQIRAHEFLEGIKNLLRKHRLVESLTVCEETPGPVARVIKAALLTHDEPEKILTAIQAAAIVELPALERRISTIGMIAKIAPMLGLLGTVLSLFESFFSMKQAGPYAGIETFSASIAQALIATITGLALSIFSYICYHFLLGRVRAIVHDIEWSGNEIHQFLGDFGKKTSHHETHN